MAAMNHPPLKPGKSIKTWIGAGKMAANFVSGGANIAFWDEQTLSKNPNLQNCDPPDALKCNSHWNSLAFSPNSKHAAITWIL